MKVSKIVEMIESGMVTAEKYLDLSDLARDLMILDCDYLEADESLIEGYWVAPHYDTDAWVGLFAYTYKGKVICFSKQSGRKQGPEFYWLSQCKAVEAKDYILSLMAEEEEELHINIVDLNEDIGQGYSVHYGGQILSKELINADTNQNVKVNKTFRSMNDIDKWGKVLVEFNSGKIELANLNNYLVPYFPTNKGG